jgi:hypothetical protein
MRREERVMKASELAKKMREVAEKYKTIYVLGCFGAPMKTAYIDRYLKAQSYNKGREKLIRKVENKGYFGFDCVCLIKAILWGWRGDQSKAYGGAAYASNGVPDIDTESMIARCKSVSKKFDNVEIGELLWKKGHVGIYIGEGLAVECTPAWENKVQITAVGNIGSVKGYKKRSWTSHGKLPYVTYEEVGKAISGRNRYRHKDEIIIYSGNGKTGCNKYGCEAQVSSSGKCLNTPVYGKCNLAIPQNGYVISGHGKGSDWILATLKKGKTVKLVGSSIVVK